jgi:hypothetical protein
MIPCDPCKCVLEKAITNAAAGTGGNPGSVDMLLPK